jgi:hypothetical protein
MIDPVGRTSGLPVPGASGPGSAVRDFAYWTVRDLSPRWQGGNRWPLLPQ